MSQYFFNRLDVNLDVLHSEIESEIPDLTGLTLSTTLQVEFSRSLQESEKQLLEDLVNNHVYVVPSSSLSKEEVLQMIKQIEAYLSTQG
jgi:hypothetical protein